MQILIDDIGKTLIPVVQLTVKLHRLTKESIDKKQMLKGLFNFGLSYYNPLSGKVEPIIETNQFAICQVINPLIDPKNYITLEKMSTAQSVLYQEEQQKDSIESSMVSDESFDDDRGSIQDKTLNINISEEMIAGLLKTYWSLEKELLAFKELETKESKKNIPYQSRMIRKNTTNKKYYQDYMRYVSIYSISNETGYDLELIRDENQKNYALNAQRSYNTGLSTRNALEERLNKNNIVKNGQSENFEVHSDETNFERTFHKTHKITVAFISYGNVENQIKDIELNRIRRKRYYWDKTQPFPKFFIGEVRVINSRKNLLLTSPIIIQNNLNKILWILLKSPRFKPMQLEIKSSNSTSIPTEYVEEMGAFQIKVSDSEDHYTRSVSINSYIYIISYI